MVSTACVFPMMPNAHNVCLVLNRKGALLNISTQHRPGMAWPTVVDSEFQVLSLMSADFSYT
jgi:hypothetical protein